MSAVVLLLSVLVPLTTAQIVASGRGGGIGGPSAVQRDNSKYKLNGTVADSVTGEVISRALVQISGVSQNAVLTDSNGQFQFEGLSRSSANVTVRKPGYFSDQEVARSPAAYRASMVDIGPDTEPLVLKLVPAATLTGSVTGSDSEPVEGAQVRLFAAQIVNGRKRWQQVGTGMSDEDGHYRIGNLRPGTYVISVGAPDKIDFAALTQSRPLGYPVEWFYPGVPERSAAAAVELGPAQNFQADFTLPEQPIFRIAGTVVRPPEALAGGLQLLSAGGYTIGVPLRFQPNGQFEMRQVPAGKYILQANAGDHQGHQYVAQIPISVSSNVNGIVMALGTSPAIPVVVRTEFTRPDTQQFGGRRPPAIQVQLQSLDPPYGVIYAQSAGPDNPELQVRDARPGQYVIEFPQGYGHYVQSATCGSTDLLLEPLVIAPGVQVPPIMVTLRDDGGTLVVNPNGTVPATGAQVLVLTDDAPMQPPRIAFMPQPASQQTGGSGAFVFHGPYGANAGTTQIGGLAPGSYTVIAFDRIDGLEYANPDVMRPYLSRAAHATIYRNGKTSVSVVVIRLGK